MTRPDRLLRAALLAAAAGMALLAPPALAQNEQTEEMVDQAESLTPDDPVGEEQPVAPLAGKSDLVVAPIPLSNPSLGTGLAATAVLYYNPNAGPELWSSGLAAGYTSSKSWFVGGYHKMSLADDRIRFMGVAGYTQANLDFYGIGADAGEAGFSVELHNRIIGGYADVQVQPFTRGLLRHLHVGGRVAVTDLSASVDLPVEDLPDFVPDRIERSSTIVKIGPGFTYDSLDNAQNPSKGVLVEGRLMYGAGWLGSDYSHHKFDLAANGFFRIGERSVLAIRRQLCTASEETPYYDLCMFGRGADLRGYEAGRYRDRATWAIQAEWRRKLAGKFGAVAFFGVGGVAEGAKAIWKDSTVLTSGGVGVRYLASASANVNLRADVAYGAEGFAFYFGIGEAF